MARLSDEEKQELIATTRETALAMVEDMEYIRDIVSKTDPISRDIRHLSNVLRRLLIDQGGDLRKVLSPRLGRRLHLSAPDLGTLIKSVGNSPLVFLSAGAAHVFGIAVGLWSVASGNTSFNPPADYHPDKTIQLRLDNFVSQKVIYYRGDWITRADAIKYIANVAHGVHSGDPKEPKHELLKRIRYIATIQLSDVPTISFNPEAVVTGDKPAAMHRNTLDFVLIQLMSTARYLTNSPDIHELEGLIRVECGRRS